LNKYIGCFATSIAGHDHNNIYVIIDADDEYVYLVDGKIRKVNNPKKKKLKHVQLIKRTDDTIAGRINNNVALSNEDIKYAIKNIQ
jgi:hypothetical protein